MPNLAIQRIHQNIEAHARGEDAVFLDLGNCGLTEVPKEIGKCVWLQELSFSGGWWDDEKQKWQSCQNSGQANNLGNISGLEYLTKLQKLFLAGDVHATKWDLADISPLARLTNLQQLSLARTQVSDINPLAKLTNLVSLSLTQTLVSDITPLAPLTNLEQLSVMATPVSDLSPLATLTRLRQLDCKNTAVVDLSPLSNLTNLKQLDCSHTKVSDLSPILPLIKQGLPIHFKKAVQVGGDWINVDHCPLVHPPEEVVMQGNEVVVSYFEKGDKGSEQRKLRTYTTHYRAYFSIQPEHPPDKQDFWSILVKRVGEWLYDRYADVRCNRTGIIRSWLFLGGEWFSDLPDVTADVRTFHADTPESDPPRYWTFRLQERDRDHLERYWRTDIGITSVGNQRFDVSVILSHYVIPGHFAKDPPEPEPAVSSLVDYLFDLDGSHIQCADQRLYSFAQPLLPGQAEGFVKWLADPARRHLLVLVKPDEAGRFHIDPESLAQILVGNANVYYYDSEQVEMEMQRSLGEHYSTYYCARNAARIYQTSVNFLDPKDYSRHRFFLFRNYADTKDLEAVLFKWLQRRKEPPFSDFVSFKEDIHYKQKEQRLRELTLMAQSAPKPEQGEYIKLIEEEMQALQQSNDEIDGVLQQKDEKILFGKGEKEELEHRLKRLEFENKQLGEILQAYEIKFSPSPSEQSASVSPLPPPPPLLPRLSSPAPKSILAIESAGNHCAAQIAVLEALEARLREISNNPAHRLCDTFDLVGGAGLGASIAVMLAAGEPVQVIREGLVSMIRQNEQAPATKSGRPAGFKFGYGREAGDAWHTGLLHFQRDKTLGSLQLWSNHPNAAQAPFDLSAEPKSSDFEVFNTSDARIPSGLSAEPGLFQNPELLLFHIATHPEYPFRWQVGEEHLLVVSIAAPNPLPMDSDDPMVATLAEAQQKHNRLAEQFFTGYAPTGPHAQQGAPSGFAPARWLRISQAALPAGELPDDSFLREQAKRALESIDLSVLMPMKTA